jgi:large subunit ribosomal protein L6
MSRIGKNPVLVPEKTQVTVSNGTVNVKGPNGELSYTPTKLVTVEVANNEVTIKPVSEDASSKSMWGLTRTLVQNMVTGVSTGFTKTLEFNGVGYKAAVAGDVLTLNLGYSHPVEYKLPKGISAKVVKNSIELSGNDKELVGFAAAQIRSFRKPEPYKGKGIKYSDETIIRKAGKTGAKK